MCYRKNGHNEIDEPMFTQPLMYKKVKAMKTCLQQYAEKIISEGSVSQSEFEVSHPIFPTIHRFNAAKTVVKQEFSI